MTGYVYVITNTVNGKQYVGQTTSTPAKRFAKHVSEALASSCGRCRALHAAIRKYGPSVFTVDIIVHLETCTRHDLDQRERDAICKLNSRRPAGYNLMAGGGGGGPLHEETKAKISRALKGRVFSPVWRKNMSAARIGKKKPASCGIKLRAAFKGRVVSDQTRVKMVEAWKRRRLRPISAETRARLSAALRRRPMTPERIAALDRARTLIGPLSAERKAAIGAFHRGKVMSAETRAKMSAAHKGKTLSPETRAKQAESRRCRWQERHGDVA